MINKNMQATLKEIEKAKKVALFHHVNIDGDSFSSSYGLALALKAKYPKKEIVWVADVEYIKENFKFIKYDESIVVSSIDNTYLSIIGDTSSAKMIYKLEEYQKGFKKICFDHHQNDPTMKFDIFWKESSFIASSMQAYMIAKELKIKWNEEIAFNLCIGILTDSGNFAYSLADSKPVEMFAELLKHISNEKMNKFYNGFRNKDLKSFEAQKFLMQNVKFNGQLAYVLIKKKVLNKNPHFGRIKNKINTIGNIGKYNIWSIMFEDKDEQGKSFIRIHLRTNGPDISKLAIKYNGGGHKRAAGCRVSNYKELKLFINELNKI